MDHAEHCGIVIPAYRAEQTLDGVLARIPQPFGASLRGVWVVDDGSPTSLRPLIERHRAAGCLPLKLIPLAQNRGYGGAMKVGLRAALAAGASHIACLHADGQYPPEMLPELFQRLIDEHLALLQGSRLASAGALAGGMPRYKFAAGKLLTALERWSFHLPLTDGHSGYLLYGPRALGALPLMSVSDSFDFDLELIACCAAARLPFAEAAIPTHYGEEVSHLNPLSYGLRVLRVLARYRAGHYHRLLAGQR